MPLSPLILFVYAGILGFVSGHFNPVPNLQPLAGYAKFPGQKLLGKLDAFANYEVYNCPVINNCDNHATAPLCDIAVNNTKPVAAGLVIVAAPTVARRGGLGRAGAV